MCTGAIYWSSIGRVVFGLSQTRLYELIRQEAGDASGLDPLMCRAAISRRPPALEVLGPALEDEALSVHAGFWSAGLTLAISTHWNEPSMPHSLVETANFRPLRADDEDFLWEMLRLAVFTPPGEPTPSVASVKSPPLAAYVDGWMRPDDFGNLLRVGGRAVGAAWARFFPDTAPGYGYVSAAIPELSVALLPDVRGQGLGTALITRTVAQARTRADGLSLSVSQANPARRLYRRTGFRVVDRRGESLVMLLSWDPTITS